MFHPKLGDLKITKRPAGWALALPIEIANTKTRISKSFPKWFVNVFIA
jgi:hypothetical protein